MTIDLPSLPGSTFVIRGSGPGFDVLCTVCDHVTYHAHTADLDAMLVTLHAHASVAFHRSRMIPNDPRYSVTNGEGRVWEYSETTSRYGAAITAATAVVSGGMTWAQLWDYAVKGNGYRLYLVTTGEELASDVQP